MLRIMQLTLMFLGVVFVVGLGAGFLIGDVSRNSLEEQPTVRIKSKGIVELIKARLQPGQGERPDPDEEELFADEAELWPEEKDKGVEPDNGVKEKASYAEALEILQSIAEPVRYEGGASLAGGG